MAPMFGQMITDMAPGIKKADGCIITTFTCYIHSQLLALEKLSKDEGRWVSVG